MKYIIEIIISLFLLICIILIYCCIIISGRINRRDDERDRNFPKER